MRKKQKITQQAEEVPPPKRYLRVGGLCSRYGVCSKTIDRWRKLGRIPKPSFRQAMIPFWDTDRLDEYDRQAARKTAA